MITLKCTVLTALLICIATFTTFGQTAQFSTETFEFSPDGFRQVTAGWEALLGLPDRDGNQSFGLRLEKIAPTNAPTSAGVILQGLGREVVVSSDVFGFDFRNDSKCTGGSPRFNVGYLLPDGSEGFSFVGGCANGTITPAPQNPRDWSRVTFDLQNGSQSFPVVPIGALITHAALIVDEQGQYTIDNIRFRDQFADKPGLSGAEPSGGGGIR